ncbi:hypothetical protein J32TS6_25000 [Virgibacillus pantothenticus]|nr:hypothetical protein J32TS6_25000 [Virgibacillus pantothenticus]
MAFRVNKPISIHAPYVGAWIEILSDILEEQVPEVAPYVGVWIEISDFLTINQARRMVSLIYI